MKKEVLILLLLQLFLISCNNRVGLLKELDIIMPTNLNNSEVIIDGLFGVTDICISDTLIILSFRNSEKMIRVFNESSDLIGEGLKFGRGPGETTNILEISNISNGRVCATVADEKVYIYKISSLISGSILPESIIALKKDNYAFSSIAVCDSSLFYVGKDVTNHNENNTIYCYYNLLTDVITYFGNTFNKYLQSKDYPVDDFTIQTAYQGEPVCRPDMKKAVIPFFYALAFDIVNLTEDNYDVEYRKVFTTPGVKIEPITSLGINAVRRDGSSYVGFLDASCTQQYIYVLYSAKRFSDHNYDQGRYILKYDWDGNLITKFSLDKEVSDFCVSSDNEYILCIYNTDDDVSLIRYNL